MNEEIDELYGRVDALQCVLRVLLLELGKSSPARKKVREELQAEMGRLADLNPGGNRLYGMREAYKDMGL